MTIGTTSYNVLTGSKRKIHLISSTVTKGTGEIMTGSAFKHVFHPPCISRNFVKLSVQRNSGFFDLQSQINNNDREKEEINNN